MNDKKFCFILCANSQFFLEECIKYIERLIIPDGYDIDIISVSEANSMTEGYNQAMQTTDAKYKIYMHQDVFILYPNILQAILDVFSSDDTIGMLGIVGAEKMAPDGVMWHDYRRGNLYASGLEDSFDELNYETYRYKITDGIWNVQVIDGLMMVTSKDIPWREDVFDGWDYYDVSQSYEMMRAGYKVVVPEQRLPWCRHDDGILNLRNHDKYRKICSKEYKCFTV